MHPPIDQRVALCRLGESGSLSQGDNGLNFCPKLAFGTYAATSGCVDPVALSYVMDKTLKQWAPHGGRPWA